ncbi:MAG: ABC transporter permease [Anaerolineae bacterium]
MAVAEGKPLPGGSSPLRRPLRWFRGSESGAVFGLISPAALWLLIFFLIPLVMVLLVSFGERGDAGQVVYSWTPKNYARFFSKVGERYLYIQIFGRSLGIALANTVLCLLVGYPLAYYIARQPTRRRNVMLLLVMIPFWTNFLVRTYAWMVILRDTGVINNALRGLGLITEPLPLLFNQGAVIMGLFYGFLPFMILPLYASIEKLDFSLVEAAQDLGADALRTFLRVILPLTRPGIIAGSILVFIPSVGAFVTPDLMGGAKVTMIGNLLQQQFLKVRDWPFGSAVGFILMLTVLVATLLYFRSGGKTL